MVLGEHLVSPQHLNTSLHSSVYLGQCPLLLGLGIWSQVSLSRLSLFIFVKFLKVWHPVNSFKVLSVCSSDPVTDLWHKSKGDPAFKRDHRIIACRSLRSSVMSYAWVFEISICCIFLFVQSKQGCKENKGKASNCEFQVSAVLCC